MTRDLTPWVRLRANAYMDPKMIDAGNQAELVYYRSLQMAKAMGDTGRLHRHHIVGLMRGVRGKTALVATLLEHNLWVQCHDSDYLLIASWEKHNGEPQATPKKVVKAVDGSPRARVRGRQDKTREELERSPSGSDRSSSARAAPLRMDGSARPAPAMDHVLADYDLEDSGTVDPTSESVASIRKTLAKSTKATGRNPMVSKWNREQNDYRLFADSNAALDEAIAEQNGDAE